MLVILHEQFQQAKCERWVCGWWLVYGQFNLKDVDPGVRGPDGDDRELPERERDGRGGERDPAGDQEQVPDQEAQGLRQGRGGAEADHPQEAPVHAQPQGGQPRQGVQEQRQEVQADHHCLQKRLRSHHQPRPDALQLQGVPEAGDRRDDRDLQDTAGQVLQGGRERGQARGRGAHGGGVLRAQEQAGPLRGRAQHRRHLRGAAELPRQRPADRPRAAQEPGLRAHPQRPLQDRGDREVRLPPQPARLPEPQAALRHHPARQHRLQHPPRGRVHHPPQEHGGRRPHHQGTSGRTQILKEQENGSVIQRFCLALLQKCSVKDTVIPTFMEQDMINWIMALIKRSLKEKIHHFSLDFGSALLANIIHAPSTLSALAQDPKQAQVLMETMLRMLKETNLQVSILMHLLICLSYLSKEEFFKAQKENCNFVERISDFVEHYSQINTSENEAAEIDKRTVLDLCAHMFHPKDVDLDNSESIEYNELKTEDRIREYENEQGELIFECFQDEV